MWQAIPGLMGEDEKGTLSQLRALRKEVLEPAVSSSRGTVIKRMGDGWLVEFSSVSEAVACAVDIQQIQNDNGDLKLRIGVHVGDVTHGDEDIHGDGINIAARLQAEADPGAIIISEFTRRAIDEKLAAAFVDLGARELKNISHPVRVFAWGMDATPDDGGSTQEPTLPLPDKPSIAVLPFANVTGDPEQGYFSDGITEDIITDLSKVSGLFVIARTSSFAFKGVSLGIAEISRKLGVRYILEGSVRRAGNRIRISTQLVNGSDGQQLWAERFDRDLEDIFTVQDDVTRKIVAALETELTAAEVAQRQIPHKLNAEAYDLYYHARDLMYQFTEKSIRKSRETARKAIDIDPRFARAHAVVSISLFVDHLNEWNGTGAPLLPVALDEAQRACELDPGDATGFVALALCRIWAGDLGAVEQAARTAIKLDPNHPHAHSVLGQSLDFSGRHEQAAVEFELAWRLDPEQDFLLNQLGRALFGMGKYDEAEARFKQRLARNPGTDITRAYLAALYGNQGRHAEAQATWQELLSVNPDFDVKRLRSTLPYTGDQWFNRFYGGLEAAGLIEVD